MQHSVSSKMQSITTYIRRKNYVEVETKVLITTIGPYLNRFDQHSCEIKFPVFNFYFPSSNYCIFKIFT